jgi:hypothetical protein
MSILTQVGMISLVKQITYAADMGLQYLLYLLMLRYRMTAAIR